MKATILGIHEVEYKKEGEQKKGVMFYISFPSEGVEGVESGGIWWDTKRNGKPPQLAVGGVTDVSYNKFGKLRFGL